MLLFYGLPAHDDFSSAQLLTRVQSCVPQVKALRSVPVYFVFCEHALTPHAEEILRDLLQAQSTAPSVTPHLWVLPRHDTISPWASKVSEIALRSGLDAIKLIERGVAWYFDVSPQVGRQDPPDQEALLMACAPVMHDPMLEDTVTCKEALADFFAPPATAVDDDIPFMTEGKKALAAYNQQQGLALDDAEIDYFAALCRKEKRDPTPAEIAMFAQVNSEHCRHKIFRAHWQGVGVTHDLTLLEQIQSTYQYSLEHSQEGSPKRVLSAYVDNAAVVRRYPSALFHANRNGRYQAVDCDTHLLLKAETHNHPTAISPFPGAATGAGGEIRDELAVGRGGFCKAGLVGFAVANLALPNYQRSWEKDEISVAGFSSPLDIMLEAPLGAAAFNNEFGRASLVGYFRTYAACDPRNGRHYGYHKPIMLAGGYGSVHDAHVAKKTIPPGALLIVLGGASMRIGLGGGTASSQTASDNSKEHNFASVQRHNPEMQRRCYEVIRQCTALGEENPILSIHDVGAGGLSNALPELVHDNGLGADIALRDIPTAESNMSAYEIWCNESQERFVIALLSQELPLWKKLCQRERAPFAVVGRTNKTGRLRVFDCSENEVSFDVAPTTTRRVIDFSLFALFDSTPPLVKSLPVLTEPLAEAINWQDLVMTDALRQVLCVPCVADKRFLITIADRTVGGLTVRDQMVGPWQVAVADCAITAADFTSYVGEAMAIGERAPLAINNAPASGRMAVGEAITNIAAARIFSISDIVLSANWMAASGYPEEDKKLYETVAAVAKFCQQLGIVIPVGKDSLSMHCRVDQDNKQSIVKAPLSLVVSAFAPVADTRQSLTPMLNCEEPSELWLFDLGLGKNRLGGSALLQSHNQITGAPPDITDAALLSAFFQAIQLLHESGLLQAYHDRSDGGLWATLLEMAFATHSGLSITLNAESSREQLAELFNEELGAVVQVKIADRALFLKTVNSFPLLLGHCHLVACPRKDTKIVLRHDGGIISDEDLFYWLAVWGGTSHALRLLRDHPDCVTEEKEQILDAADPGLFALPTFSPSEKFSIAKEKPRAAILREQGVNGHVEMAAALTMAGFEAIDVHMQDLIDRHYALSEFQMLVACGGFSYGDALGAGVGWAHGIRHNKYLDEEFRSFFARENTLSLGVCNGCQMLAYLHDLIPGAHHWPRFIPNRSGRFEARLVMVEVLNSTSVLFDGMVGSRLPIVISHGEGQACLADTANSTLATLRYVDNRGQATAHYPENPNGSSGGLTGFTSRDGRHNIMMPHPERLFLRQQFSWCPKSWRYPEGPWLRLFQNSASWLSAH